MENNAMAARLASNACIKLENGEEHVLPSSCVKKFFYVSNNDSCEVCARYFGENAENIVIDGGGSKLVMHGRITPFVFSGCKNVTIKNFTVDYADLFYMQADVVGAESDVLRLDASCYKGKYRIEEGTLKVYGENFENRFDDGCIMQEFDRVTRAPAYNGATVLAQIGDMENPTIEGCLPISVFRISETERGFDLFKKDIGKFINEGRTLVMSAEPRNASALLALDCENIRIENVTVKHSPAMGFIFQMCDNVSLRGIKIKLDDDSEELCTALADAVHCINCGGKLELCDSVLENMMDDALNVHGSYLEVSQASGRSFSVKIGHEQQRGFIPFIAGDKLVLHKGKTARIKGEYTVERITLSSDGYSAELEIDAEAAEAGDVAENRERMPEVYVRGVRTGNNRPRGILVTTPKKALIEDCVFYNSAQGVFVNGETEYWHESGSLTDLTVRRNKFENCNYCYGEHAVEIRPQYDRTGGGKFHSGIKIYDNEFLTFTGGAIAVSDSENIEVKGNKIIVTDAYPARQKNLSVDIKRCENASVDIFNFDFEMLENEHWWGGAIRHAQFMPLDRDSVYEINLDEACTSNQINTLFLSDKGRSVYSEKAYAIKFNNGKVKVRGNAPIEFKTGGKNLKGAYLTVAGEHFADKKPIDSFLLTEPQYNSWIPFTYNQTQEKVLNYAESIIAAGLKPGLLIIDCGWMNYYGDWDFDSRKFPDPAAMVKKLHDMGFKVSVWAVPFVSADSEAYRKLRHGKKLLRRQDGKSHLAGWWDGYSAVLDFTCGEARDYFIAQIKRLSDKYGIDGLKLDAGDFNGYDKTCLAAGDSSVSEQVKAFSAVANAFGICELRSCFMHGGEPIIQRLHDKHHSWREWCGIKGLIPDMLAEGLAGYAYCCPDMAGGGDAGEFYSKIDSLDEELFVRWCQCIALMPSIQLSYPVWAEISPANANLCKKFIELRQRYKNYIEQLAAHAAKTGEPIMRSVCYEFGEMPVLKDEYLLGDKILVAPVLEKGQTERRLWLPKGKWRYEGDDKNILYDGGKTVTVFAPLETLPYFTRID